MPDPTERVSGKIVTLFLRAFYSALQSAHARYLVKYPGVTRELGAFVNHSLSSPGYFDKWFADYPALRFSDQIVSELIFNRSIERRIFTRDEFEKLSPLHADYIKYLESVGGHSNISSAGVEKQHTALMKKMLINSGFSSASKILDYDNISVFVNDHIEAYARIGQISAATRNCKIIVSKLVGPDDLRLDAIERGDRTNWVASYAALKGALAAAQAEDHKALAFFETILRRLQVETCGDGFISAAYEAVSYLSRKYLLDFMEHDYPQIGPAMRSYLIISSNPKSFYDIPADVHAAVMKSVSVEFRHRGAHLETEAPGENKITLNGIHEKGLNLSVAAKRSDIQVQMMLSEAWTYYKAGNLLKAEAIARECRKMSKEFDGKSIIQAEVGELTGYLSLRTSEPQSSQYESAKIFLESIARKFEEIGSISRAETIIDEIEKN